MGTADDGLTLRAVEARQGGAMGSARQYLRAWARALYRRGGKRAFDLGAASLGLAVLAPFFLLLAVLIRLTSPGKALFWQERMGKDGRPFRLLKFRTMRADAGASGKRLTARDDPRVSPLGRILRRFKLDELPQLYNVLRGEMSLVGPRPELPAYVALYTPEQRTVLRLQPGITGPASLAFWNQEALLADRPDWNEFYVKELMPRKLALNLAYAERMSFLGDLGWLLQTVFWLVSDPLRETGKTLWGRAEVRRAGQRALDGLAVALGLFFAYELRFEGALEPSHWYQFWLLLPVVTLGRVLMNEAFGVYRLIWRYVSTREALQVGLSYWSFSFLLLILRLGLPETSWLLRPPIGVIAIEFFLALLFALGMRLSRRLLYERWDQTGPDKPARQKVLLVGAGQLGAQVAKTLARVPGCCVVGFLDDDRRKWGMWVAGRRVLGSLEKLPTIVRQEQVDDVILCIGRQRESVTRRFLRLTAPLPVRVRLAPNPEELVNGSAVFGLLRSVNETELLDRETIDIQAALSRLERYYRGRRILVTGAGGSIGSELSRQLLQLKPASLMLLDKDENCLFDLLGDLGRTSASRVITLVRDIRYQEGLRSFLLAHRPEIIFHAAAHKHVPLMEANPAEAVRNNVFGTLTLVELAEAFGTERFLLISTDKAVRPANVMGASKRLAELIVQQRAQKHATRFGCVRFGNVMGSRGSVIPLFKRQLAAGGPLTITHPEVMRYFMTIPEAVLLILQAASLAEQGEIYVLDMGDPRKVIELARELIALSGLCPDKDIPLMVTGLRAGEKLREELSGPGERLEPTAFERIQVIRRRSRCFLDLNRWLKRLEAACQRDDGEAVRPILVEMGLLEPAPTNDATLVPWSLAGRKAL